MRRNSYQVFIFPILIVPLLVLTSCSDAIHGPASEKYSDWFGKAETTFELINIKIIQSKCVECHSGVDAEHNVDLSSYEKIMNNNIFPPLVVPGNPEASSLYKSVADNSMPKNKRPLRQNQRTALYKWILDGALKEPIDDGGSKPPCEGDKCDSDDNGGNNGDEPCDEDEPCDPIIKQVGH